MPVRNFTPVPLWLWTLLLALVGAGFAWKPHAMGSERPSSTFTPASIHSSQSLTGSIGEGSEANPSDVAATIPLAARDTLKSVEERHGKPMPGYIGGRPFLNRGRVLPSGRYREYDVHPKVPGKNRGAERIVINELTGKAYYTADHYRSFVPMN